MYPPQGLVRSKQSGGILSVEKKHGLKKNLGVMSAMSIVIGCVIGAGSVVTRDIPAGVVAAGSPCRVLREVTEADKLDLTNIR